jgi:hypothetical protein
MANGTTAIPPIGTTPASGGLNYADYQKQIEQTAAKTKAVDAGTNISALSSLVKKSTNLSPIKREQAGVAISNYEQQLATTKQQAQKAGQALEMVGASTLQGMQNLEAIQAGIKNQVASASDAFGAAAEKADDYVKAARGRVTEVLSKIDEINTKIGQDRDFAQAHAMQAAVQSALGSMKDEERNIVENYGTDSKEYAQFKQSKMNTLATVQSNIQANYSQLREQQGQTYLNAVSDAYTKSNMYVGFQEQQHVEMLKFRDEQRYAYSLQASQLDVSIEQMKMAGMENLANWIVSTPTFAMDATPLVTMLADLGVGQAQQSRPTQPIALPYGGAGGVTYR